MNRTIEVLQQVKLLIETYGWIQRAYGDSSVGYCLRGALYKACYSYKGQRVGIEDALQTALHRRTGKFSLALYNDLLSTTKEDILSLIDDAIVIAKEKDSE